MNLLCCAGWGWKRGIALALLPLAFSAQAADAKAYVGNFKDNTVSVIDTGNQTVTSVIPVATGPHGLVLSPDGLRLYVSGDGSSQVSVIDTQADRVLRSFEVGRTPHGLALADDGRQLLVAMNGEDRIAVVDTGDGHSIGSIAVGKPHTISVLPGTQRAYVSSQLPGHFAIVVVDLKTLTVLRQLPLDKPPRDVEAAFDGRAVYFTTAGENAVQVLDPRSDAIVARIPTGASPHIAALFAGVGVGTVVVQGPGEVSLFDPATREVTRSIGVGKQPHWVAPGPDGRTLYVSNEGSDDVTIVDLASGSTRSVAVGHAPRKIVVQRAMPVPAATGSARVAIRNFAFAPSDLVIDAGQSVTWTNDDGAPHGLVFADAGPGTELLLPGQSFSRRFDQPGTVNYACSIHAYMVAKVVVRPH